MISRQLPPVGLPAAPSARATSTYDGPVTADMVSLGSSLGCPYLARMQAPASEAPAQQHEGLNKTAASSAALASVAGGLGMGAAAACCPHTSNQQEQ